MKQLREFILSSAWILWIVLLIAQVMLILFLYHPAFFSSLLPSTG